MSVESIDESTSAQRTSCSLSLSTEHLDSSHKLVPLRSSTLTNYLTKLPSSRSVVVTKFAHKRFKRMQKYDVIKHSPPKGLIFVWPQRRNFLYEKEYKITIRIVAHILYWLNELGIFPSGSGIPFKQPSWTVRPLIPKPENRDYIIEPDWNSLFY